MPRLSKKFKQAIQEIPVEELQKLELTGFWVGGNEWRVNFAAPASGTWEYVSVSTEKAMHNKKGKLEVTAWSDEELEANPVRRGFIRVNRSGKNAGHGFEYADGEPFLWIGDTWCYLIHRFGAYNVIWVLAGEYNMHNNAGFSLDFWKELGEMVKNEDPWNRIVSLHNTPPFWDGGAEAPQWSTGEVLHNEPWLDYNQSQSGHGKYANEMIPLIVAGEYQRQPAKPIVITEPWYEFVEGNPTGKDIRLAAWGAVLSGSAGHTYGGGHVWLASVPESPSRGGGTWPIEVGAEIKSFDYEGAVSMQHLAAFFKKVKWWDMKPSPQLITDSPQPFCLANPGKEYVVYLRYGGMIHLDMGEAAVGKQFSFYWYNPATGESTSERKITGGRKVQFTAPGMYPATLDYSDWVLHIFENYE